MIALTLLLWTGAVRADDLDAAWARATALEATDPAAALDALSPWRAAYPEDYALALQVGWLAFRTGRYALAESSYRAAWTLSGGARDAGLGLAWTAFRRGDLPACRRWLDRIPEDAEAEALRRLLTTPWATARVGGGYTALDTHPRAAGIAQGHAGLAVGRWPWSAGATVWVWPTVGEQDLDLDGWGRVGLDGRWVGVEAVGAGLTQTHATAPPGFVVGGIGRVHLPIDVRIEASFTRPREPGPDVGRFALSAWGASGVVALAPHAALQRVGTDWLGSGGATLYVSSDVIGVWLGGRYGPQRVTSQLDLGTHAAWPTPERAGLWAGLRVGPWERTWVSVGWSATWLEEARGSGRWASRPTHTVSVTLRPVL